MAVTVADIKIYLGRSMIGSIHTRRLATNTFNIFAVYKKTKTNNSQKSKYFKSQKLVCSRIVVTLQMSKNCYLCLYLLMKTISLVCYVYTRRFSSVCIRCFTNASSDWYFTYLSLSSNNDLSYGQRPLQELCEQMSPSHHASSQPRPKKLRKQKNNNSKLDPYVYGWQLPC